MKVEANAKINIGLAVGKKREDGFHPIRSYFARISLADEINIDIRPKSVFSCVIHSDVEYLEDGKEDIMEKCAKAFSVYTGLCFSIDIDIKKRIPFKAGLGGGSSDGAAILKVLNGYFGNPLCFEELLSLGASCGSDIPFFLTDFSFAYVEGRGEIIKKAEIPKGFDYVLLFMPDESVSTAGAYKALDLLDYEFKTLPISLEYPICKDDFPNDFERVSKNKLLDSLIDVYKDKAFVSLSGSGAGCYVLSSHEDLPFLEHLAPYSYFKSRII